MAELFAERRVAVQAEIDAQLREVTEGARPRASVQVPVLGQTEGVQSTRTGETKTARPEGHAAGIAASSPVAKSAAGRKAMDTTPTAPGLGSEVPQARRRGTAVGPLLALLAAAGAGAAAVLGPRPTQTCRRTPRKGGRRAAQRISRCRRVRATRTVRRAGRAPISLCRAGACVSSCDPNGHVVADEADLSNDATIWVGGIPSP